MAQSNSEKKVGIVVRYSINRADGGCYSETFTGVDAQKSSVWSFKPVKLVPGDYDYSGRHDHGELPPLRNQTDLGRLLVCVQEAKEHNDRFITEKIQGFKNREIKEVDDDPPNKKPKV